MLLTDFARGLLVLLLGLWLTTATGPAAAAGLDAGDIAFYYGSRPPIDALRHYPQVVVQPNQLQPAETVALLASGSRLYAYVSVGEVARNSVDVAKIEPHWSIASNVAWNSLVMDLANDGWREFLLREQFTPLWQQGYRAFFLDTMDSYLIAAKDGPVRQQQEDGMVALLSEIKQRFPGVRLIFNRGFELLERHARYADAVLAESLFHGYDPVSKRHAPTPESNRNWLIEQLRRTRDQFGVPVIVLDYVEPGDWANAEKTARDILALGFTPWVANGDLTWLGQGRLRHVPRTLLALIDGDGDSHGQAQLDSPLFKHLALPLEYEGYALEYRNIEQDRLPLEPLSGRYAGVVAWFGSRSAGQQAGVCARLQAEVAAGLPVAFFGSLPAGAACQQLLGYRTGPAPGPGLRIRSQAPAVGRFGTAVSIQEWGLPAIRAGKDAEPWLQLSDGNGNRFEPVQIGPFGGLALDPYVLRHGADGAASWLFDPFAFLQAALRLPAQPVFALNTDMGRRIGLVEIRGDNLLPADANGVRAAAVLAPLLQQHPLPATLALIEAELESPALTDAERQQRQLVLQPLLQLSQLELASHHYSHPYFWPVFDGERDERLLSHRYSVFMPDYLAELGREIASPFHWLQTLRRPGARLPATPLLIWSGDGRPGPAALATAQQAGISHYGGGGIDWRYDPLRLAQLSPALRPTRWGSQVLTPLIDENSFARLWHGEALNYRKVLQWNRQLGGAANVVFGQRRLKPWSLSLHADAVQRPGGVALLAELLRQQQREPLNSLWLSEYVQRTQAFQHASLAVDLNGRWQLHGNGLRSVRLPSGWLWPSASTGIAAATEDSSGRYLQLAADQVSLQFATRNGVLPALADVSAPLRAWQRDDGGTIRLAFAPREAVEFRLRSAAGCQVLQHGKPVPPHGDARGLTRYQLTGAAAQAEVQLVCAP